MRQYARERLDEAGDTERWRRRHAEYFATRTEHIVIGIRGVDEHSSRQQFDAELDNIPRRSTGD